MSSGIQVTERRTKMKSNRRKVIAKFGAVAAAVGVLALFAAPAAMAQETAPAVVTTPQGVPITSGGSTTTWTLTLPVNSHCSGDSATGHFHIFSYISSADPSTLSFNTGAPVSSDPSAEAFSLIDVNGNQYGPANTAITSGNIPQTPNLNYELFSIDGSGGNANPIPAGTYNVGIACATSTGALDQFWNVQEVFTQVSTDVDPNGETWSVVPSNVVPESPLAIALPIGALLVLGAGVVVARRRRHPADVVA
jgi:hypothetical protein